VTGVQTCALRSPRGPSRARSTSARSSWVRAGRCARSGRGSSSRRTGDLLASATATAALSAGVEKEGARWPHRSSKPACPSWWGTEGSTPSLLRQSPKRRALAIDSRSGREGARTRNSALVVPNRRAQSSLGRPRRLLERDDLPPVHWLAHTPRGDALLR